MTTDTTFAMNDFEIGTDFFDMSSFPLGATAPYLSPPNNAPLTGHEMVAAHHSSTHSSPHTTGHSPSSASGSGSGSGFRGPPGSHRKDEVTPDQLLRRQRNTIAARKYRQKKFDRIEELEKALAVALQERDDFKLQLARQEAENDALKKVMRIGKDSDA